MTDAAELPQSTVPPKAAAKSPSTRFAEGIFFNEMGIVGVKLTEFEPRSTFVHRVASMEGQLFFRSEKSRTRVLEEFFTNIRTINKRGDLVGLPITDAACEIRGAAKLIGIEVIERLRLTKGIARIADMIDTAIQTMGKAERKACNAAYKQARTEAEQNGTKMVAYQVWMVSKVGSMIQSGARDKAHFSRFLPL